MLVSFLNGKWNDDLVELGTLPFSNNWPSGVIEMGSQEKSGSSGCKWSSLNGPGSETSLQHPFLKLDEFPFLHISPLG